MKSHQEHISPITSPNVQKEALPHLRMKLSYFYHLNSMKALKQSQKALVSPLKGANLYVKMMEPWLKIDWNSRLFLLIIKTKWEEAGTVLSLLEEQPHHYPSDEF